MSNLDKITAAQLASALTTTAGQLQRRLPPEEFEALGIIMETTARRWPNQDMELPMPEYLADLEKLALKYSLQAVVDAIMELRIDPEQDFFPTPSEVAHQMEKTRLRKVPSDIYARG